MYSVISMQSTFKRIQTYLLNWTKAHSFFYFFKKPSMKVDRKFINKCKVQCRKENIELLYKIFLFNKTGIKNKHLTYKLLFCIFLIVRRRRYRILQRFKYSWYHQTYTFKSSKKLLVCLSVSISQQGMIGLGWHWNLWFLLDTDSHGNAW